MSDAYDWKNLSMNINTGATTFGVIVPAAMHMEIKEISYSNATTGASGAINQVTIRQIPSGNIRPSTSIIIDNEYIQANTPYSPRNPIKTMQENCVIEASSTNGPIIANLAYRLRYGRP